MQEHKEKFYDWRPVIELCIVLVTIIGSTVPLYIHMDSKTYAQIEAIHSEMKDFHNRLLEIYA